MIKTNRILVIGRQRDAIDDVTRILEGVGCTVTGTLSDEEAIDLEGASGYDALLIGSDVPQSDGWYATSEAGNRTPSIAAIKYHNPRSMLTQLKQAG